MLDHEKPAEGQTTTGENNLHRQNGKQENIAHDMLKSQAELRHIITYDTPLGKRSCSYIPPLSHLIPHELKERPQWVVWCAAIPRNMDKAKKITENTVKPQKMPVNPKNGYPSSHSDPKRWGTFAQTWAFYERHAGNPYVLDFGSYQQQSIVCGVGFVVTASDPFCGVDLDKCFEADGTLKPWALDIVTTLDTYTEYSPSGTGLRCFVYGNLPDGDNRTDTIEMYDKNRYLTLTGRIYAS